MTDDISQTRTDSDVLAFQEATVNYGAMTVALCQAQRPVVDLSVSCLSTRDSSERQPFTPVISFRSRFAVYMWNIYCRSCSRLFAQVVGGLSRGVWDSITLRGQDVMLTA